MFRPRPNYPWLADCRWKTAFPSVHQPGLRAGAAAGQADAGALALGRDETDAAIFAHEMAFARRLADVVVFMHQGKVWEAGPPAEIFADPKTPELRQFLSSGL